MRPLAVGVAASAILAGPPLYALMESGSITGSTALTRGLILAGACTFGASFLAGIIKDFERDARRKALGKIVHHPNTGQQNQPKNKQ